MKKTLARLRLAIGILTLLTCFQTFAFAQTDNSFPGGRWYMNASTTRMIFRFEKVSGTWRGSSIDDQGKTLERIENVTWDSKTRTLEFLRIGSGYWQWYRGTIVEGVLIARYTHSGKTDAKPTNPLDYKWKATGWNYEYLTPAMAPLVFEVVINETQYRARLRLDRAPGTPTGYAGRLKFFAKENICSEGLENDVTIEQWDGVNLRFRAFNVNIYKDLNMLFTGKVNARLIEGTLIQTQGDGQRYNHTFSGTRAEILTYGFSGKTTTARENWQLRTRRQLEHLMMAGNPAPLKSEVRILRDALPPILGTTYE
ncbi:MAG: hypothetical protein HOP19_08400, partial [Acidobacteria bacterium]|nr:hypothetical protein [Acidobacteriota bacterium]